MENGQMKNMVVLKNLPSNLIEEALVIVKSKKNVKTLEYIDKKENGKKQNSKDNCRKVESGFWKAVSGFCCRLYSPVVTTGQERFSRKFEKIL